MIEIRCCHTLEDAEPWRAAMNALNLASARPDPFSTFEFYRHHLRQAPPRRQQLWLLLAFDTGRLVGYAALRRCPQWLLGWPWTKLEWLTAHDTDRPHLVARPADTAAVAAAIYDYLLSRAPEWDLLEFQQQEEGSPLAPPASLGKAFRTRQWPNLPNGTIPIRWAGLTEYFAALSPKPRSNIGRQMRNLMGAGEVVALASSDPGALKPLFELYRGIEPQSWKSRAHADTGHDARSLQYWTSLMEEGQPMKIRIQLVLLDGAPVSGLICGIFGRTVYALHIVHDERLARLGPGSAVLLMGLRHAIEGGFATFDLLRGSAYYKTRWLAEMTDTHSLQLYHARSPVYWRRALGDSLRRLIQPLRPHLPPLFNPLRRRVARTTDGAAYLQWASRRKSDHALLVAHARALPGEFLTSRQLRDALPIRARRA